MVTAQSAPSAFIKTADNSREVNRLEEINLQVMKGNGFPEIIEKFNLFPSRARRPAWLD